MTVRHHQADFRRLSEGELQAWAGADPAGASDCLERSMAMDAGIQPLDQTALPDVL